MSVVPHVLPDFMHYGKQSDIGFAAPCWRAKEDVLGRKQSRIVHLTLNAIELIHS